MATHQSPQQKKTVQRVMHEFKHGELKTARGSRNVKKSAASNSDRAARGRRL
jgi:hypothetical protein